MSTVASSDPEIAQVIENEQRRQRHQLVMIASENTRAQQYWKLLVLF